MGRPIACSSVQPVSVEATAFISATRPSTSVAITPSPMLASVTLRCSRSSAICLATRSCALTREVTSEASPMSSSALTIPLPMRPPTAERYARSHALAAGAKQVRFDLGHLRGVVTRMIVHHRSGLAFGSRRASTPSSPSFCRISANSPQRATRVLPVLSAGARTRRSARGCRSSGRPRRSSAPGTRDTAARVGLQAGVGRP